MPPSRFVRLESEEDARLREIEQDPLLKPKVRLRAQVLRLLSGRGESVGRIAAYTGRSEASVLRDLDRWEERRFEGLADGTAPGNAPRVSGEVRAFQIRSSPSFSSKNALTSPRRSRSVSGSG